VEVSQTGDGSLSFFLVFLAGAVGGSLKFLLGSLVGEDGNSKAFVESGGNFLAGTFFGLISSGDFCFVALSFCCAEGDAIDFCLKMELKVLGLSILIVPLLQRLFENMKGEWPWLKYASS